MMPVALLADMSDLRVVLLRRYLAVADSDDMARQDGTDVLHQGLRRQGIDVAVERPFEQAVAVHLRPLEQPHERLDLGGEQQVRPAAGVVERLDAVAIADQSDLAALGIEDREGEHANEAIHAFFAPFHVGVQDHLGVGARAEAVTEPQKLLAHRLEVVDLAVVGDPPAAAGVAHGHVARRRQIDDAEALRAEREAAAAHHAAVVGPAVRGQLAHGANQRLVQLPAAVGVEADQAGNAAHVTFTAAAAGRCWQGRSGRRAAAASLAPCVPGQVATNCGQARPSNDAGGSTPRSVRMVGARSTICPCSSCALAGMPGPRARTKAFGRWLPV